MIRIDDLSVAVDGRPILRDVSLHVRAGEKAALGGASGAGKTTVLRALVGQVRAQRGTIRVDGVALGPDSVAAVRQTLCYVPQSFAYFADDAVREFLLLPFRFRANRGRAPDEARMAALLGRFGLGRAMLDARVADVSGGERQRLALVRALLLDRPVLLLDEVTSALDEANRAAVRAAILDAPDLTVLAVTHDAAWWERSGVRVTMADGAVTTVERDGGAAAVD